MLETAADLDRFITVADAAKRLCVHVDTAREWVRNETFPVPVVTVGGRHKVSLRRLVEFINADPNAKAS